VRDTEDAFFSALADLTLDALLPVSLPPRIAVVLIGGALFSVSQLHCSKISHSSSIC
jgi:hypothetical protein